MSNTRCSTSRGIDVRRMQSLLTVMSSRCLFMGPSHSARRVCIVSFSSCSQVRFAGYTSVTSKHVFSREKHTLRTSSSSLMPSNRQMKPRSSQRRPQSILSPTSAVCPRYAFLLYSFDVKISKGRRTVGHRSWSAILSVLLWAFFSLT